MLLAALGALAFLGVAAAIIVATIKGMREKPALLPHEEALGRLAELKASGTLAKISKKEVCSKLYFVMTDYVKDGFGLGGEQASLFPTSKEFIALAGALAALSNDQKEYLKKMATLCDLVKYSGYDPAAKELEGLIEAALGFVEETKP